MADACRSCGAPVLWRRHVTSGRLAPIDAEPVEGGNITLVDGGLYDVALQPDLLGAPRYVGHFATCPDAQGWRAGRERE